MDQSKADTTHTKGDISTAMIIPFVVLTFGVTWGLTWVILFAPQSIPAFLGPMGVTHPVYILGVWAPALTAIGLIGWRAGFAALMPAAPPVTSAV